MSNQPFDLLDLIAEAAPVPHAGISTCPMCRRHWLVTAADDCMLPACKCYGDPATDSGPENPARPCQRCGTAHGWTCPDMPHHRPDVVTRYFDRPVVDVVPDLGEWGA